LSLFWMVDRILGQCSVGKVVKAKMSSTASSRRRPNRNAAEVSLSTTSPTWAQVASWSGCSKIERAKVAIMGQLAREARLAMKCVRHRRQDASVSTVAMAGLMPPWASEVTSSTPDRPRATSEPRNSVDAAVSSLGHEVETDDFPAPLGVGGGGDHR